MTRLLLSGLCLIAAASLASAQTPAPPVYSLPLAGTGDGGSSLPTNKLPAPAFIPGPPGAVSPGPEETQSLPQPDPAPALEQRIKQLEMQVNQLQNPVQNQPPGNPAVPAPEGIDFPPTPAGETGLFQFPYLDMQDGFFIRSPDGKNVLRITGQVQADYHGYLNSVDTTDIDTFEVRRARLGLEATVFEYYDFRILPDFGQGKVVVQDAYANVHYWNEFQIEVGKFKQPISYEEVAIMDRYVPFLERSMIDQITPARDPGIMAHAENIFAGRFDYGFSLSNGGINGDLDTNQSSDFDARVVIRPFNSPDCWCCLCGWQFGLSGGFGNEHEPINPSILHTPAGVPWFEFNSTVTAAGVRTRFCPEVAYFLGPLGLAAQYMDQHQEMRPAAALAAPKYQIDVPMQGFYVMGTLLLTGEQRTSYTELVPLAPFDVKAPCNAPGAWELAVRVSRLEVGADAFTPGVAQLSNPALWSSGATELTSGFNWYLNKWVRIQFNWEHAWFDQPVELGTAPVGKTQHQDSLLTRFQIIF
jgi:phosphate-selective porin OprO and OprP